MRVIRLRPVVCAVLVWVVCGLAHGATAQTAHPACGLAGSWVLNAALSRGPDEPADKDGEGRSGPPGGGTGGRPGGGGGGTSVGMPGVGRGGGGMDRDRMKRVQRILQAEIEPAPRLAILCDGQQFTTTAGDERPDVLVLDGKKHLKLTGDGEVYTTTVWQEGRVVSERRYDEGIKATRTYTIETDKDGVRRLVLLLKMDGFRGSSPDRDREGRRRNGELRRVYDAAPPFVTSSSALSSDARRPSSAP